MPLSSLWGSAGQHLSEVLLAFWMQKSCPSLSWLPTNTLPTPTALLPPTAAKTQQEPQKTGACLWLFSFKKKNNEEAKTQEIKEGGGSLCSEEMLQSAELNSAHPDESRKATDLAHPLSVLVLVPMLLSPGLLAGPSVPYLGVPFAFASAPGLQIT